MTKFRIIASTKSKPGWASVSAPTPVADMEIGDHLLSAAA